MSSAPEDFSPSDLLRSMYEAKKKQEIRDDAEKCEQSLSHFIQSGWDSFKPGQAYVHNWHIGAICEKLEAVSAGEIHRLQIWVPPGTSKTATVSVFWPAWEWTTRPWLRYWGASYETRFAGRISALSRDLMMSEWYQERWEHMFKFVRDAEGYFSNDRGGTRLATAPESTGSGEHGHRILIDDPINAKEADATSQITLATTNGWYDGTVVTRGLDIGFKHARVLIMQRLHTCLPPDARVRTHKGSKKISALRPEDKVVTSAGVEEVVASASRPHKGKMFSVRMYGHCQPFRATGNHRVMTTEGWMAAGNLTSKHTLVFPIPTSSTQQIPEWPQTNGVLTVTARQGTYTGARGKTPPKERVQELVDRGLTVLEIAHELGYTSRGSAHNALLHHGISRASSRVVSSEIMFDPDFWWFVGLWQAEGCVTKSRKKVANSIRVVLHAKETDFLDRAVAMLERHGLSASVRIEGNKMQFAVNSIQLADFLSHFGKGARNKFLPDWVLNLPEDFLREMFTGYWQGDGCLTKTKTGVHLARVASSSIDLLEGWQRVLLRLGVKASVMKGRKAGAIQIRNEKPAKSGESWELRMPLSDAPWLDPDITAVAPVSQKMEIVGGCLRVPIRKVTSEDYDGEVWDIETPCHDFLTGIVQAHNSDLAQHLIDLDGSTRDGGDWEILCLPERYEPSHPYVWPNDPRTQEGELLWPAQRDEKASKSLAASLTPHRAAGQLQQRPSAKEGDILKTAWWKFYDPRIRSKEEWEKLPKFSMVVMSLDCPQKDKESNDNVAIQTWGIHGVQRYLLDLRLAKMSYPLAKRTTIEMAQWARSTWPRARHQILIENTGYGSEMIIDLKMEFTGVTKVSPQQDGDKVMRADAASDSLSSGHCFVPGYGPPWSPPVYEAGNTPADIAAMIDNFSRFPNADHDDDVDSWSQVINWLRNKQTRPLRTSSATARKTRPVPAR